MVNRDATAWRGKDDGITEFTEEGESTLTGVT
jgi:hypothetical protein